MKTLRNLLVLGAALVLGAIPVLAQNSIYMRVDVPFAFSVNETQLPAGEYVVRADSGSALIALVSRHGKGAAMFIAGPVEKMAPKGESYLEFHVTSSETYLAGIWNAAAQNGRAPARSDKFREREGTPYKVAFVRALN
jgi:hypothetical protein